MGFFSRHDEHCERDAPDSSCKCNARKMERESAPLARGGLVTQPPRPVYRKAQPNLGLATTEELITELHARMIVSKSVGGDWPNYKTAGD